MPTNPPAGLLDRDVSRVDARHLVDIASPLLREVVNYGLAAFARCVGTVKGGDDHLSVFVMLRHILEMADGVEVLVESAAPIAARPLLRSILETLLYIEYVLEPGVGSPAYVLRSYAYHVARTEGGRAQLRSMLEFDPSTDRGRRILEREKHSGVQLDLSEVKERLDALNRLRRSDTWTMVQRKRAALRKLKLRAPWYHSGPGTPGSIETLACLLHRSLDYNILYRDWSGTIHASDVSRQLLHEQPGLVSFRHLRDYEEMADITSSTVTLVTDAVRQVLLAFRPAEERAFAKWYQNEIQASLRKLGD